jgi:outer membrane protein assembly factor BamB
VAFDAKTGAVRWTATGDGASYSSGVAATLDGMRTLLFLTRDNLLGLDPATGTVRFSRRWRARQAASVNAATPVVVGDLVFVSSEYGPGAAVLQVRGSMLTERWASDEVLSTHYATAVHHGGYLYGFHGRQEFGPSFRAVEFETGRVAWSEDGFRAGSVVLAGDRLLVLRESGELLLAPASPRGGLKPVARAQIMQGIVRPHMAVANGLVYARNDNTLLCLDLRR